MPVNATAVQVAASGTVAGEGTLLVVVASVSSARACADRLCVTVEFN
jgi:arginine repressor